MNVFSTFAMDRAGYYNHLGNGRWKISKGFLVVARGHACCDMYKTHMKAYKEKFNANNFFQKTPQLRVRVNGIATKRLKFSLLDSASNKEVIFDEKFHDARNTDEVKDREGLKQGEQYPPLEIIEPLERRCTEEHPTVSQNIWASDEGGPRNWIKDIQCELNSFSIEVVEIFSLLVKIMKKVEHGVSLTSINTN